MTAGQIVDRFTCSWPTMTRHLQILDEAGMSRGALYHHFPGGKQDLFVAVADDADHLLHEGFDAVLSEVTSPVEQIAAGIDVLLGMAANPVFARIVLVEAAVAVADAALSRDLAALTGREPAAVICEIMNDDGTMARLDDLIPFARRHGLKIGTIADLIAYRSRTDRLVECVADEPFESDYGGDWRLKSYRNKIDGSVNLVLQKGPVDPAGVTLVRMHAVSIFDDIMGPFLHTACPKSATGREMQWRAQMARTSLATPARRCLAPGCWPWMPARGGPWQLARETRWISIPWIRAGLDAERGPSVDTALVVDFHGHPFR